VDLIRLDDDPSRLGPSVGCAELNVLITLALDILPGDDDNLGICIVD